MASFKIPETGAPDLSAMMLSTIRALKAVGSSATIHELDEKVVEIEGISEEQQAIGMPNDGRTKLRYFLAWSRTYLRRGGAIENSSRGVWSLTEFGQSINTLEQTKKIHRQVNEEERERQRAKRTQTTSDDVSSEEAVDESNDRTGLASDWKEQLLAVIKNMDPAAFERLAQRLLREAGFIKVEVRGRVADGGIDGLGVLRVNLVSFQVYFQCKRWKDSVGSREIRDFRGALQGRADKGLFITTATFSAQAYDEATRDGAIAIDLIDGDRLADLLKEYRLGVSTEMVESVAVNPQFFSTI